MLRLRRYQKEMMVKLNFQLIVAEGYITYQRTLNQQGLSGIVWLNSEHKEWTERDLARMDASGINYHITLDYRR